MTNKEENVQQKIEKQNNLDNIYDDKINKTNIYDDDNIKALQKSIQEISKVIEENKINLRILQERHVKKQSEYNQLAGKPIIKSKEQRLEEIKEKMQKLKAHQIFDPNYGKKNPVLQPGEETKMIQKNTDKCKIELDN